MRRGTKIGAALAAGAGQPRKITYPVLAPAAATSAAERVIRARRHNRKIQAVMRPTWNPEIESRWTSPERANRS